MAQTQMCTNDNFDDSNRAPLIKKAREAPKIGASRFKSHYFSGKKVLSGIDKYNRSNKSDRNAS